MFRKDDNNNEQCGFTRPGYLGDVTKGVLPGYESLILSVSAYQSNRTTKSFPLHNYFLIESKR